MPNNGEYSEAERLTMPDAQLNSLHKLELTEICCSDMMLMEGTREQHRREWEARMELRNSAEAKAKATATRQEKAAERVAVKEAKMAAKAATKSSEPVKREPRVKVTVVKPPNLCRACGMPIAPTGKRGKPAVYHAEHRPVKS